MNRSLLTIILIVVAIIAVVLAVRLYQEETEPALEVEIGEQGIDVETN
jgi:putative exporter of polyketide antibiotics